MVLIGLSILIASISLLYLRDLPRPWYFLVWLRGSHDTANIHNQNNHGTKMSQHIKQNKDQILNYQKEENSSKNTDENQYKSDRDTNMNKVISDYEAMPPPSLPAKKSSSLSTNNTSMKTTNTISAQSLNSTFVSHVRGDQNKPVSLAPILSRSNEIPNATSSFVLEPSVPGLSPPRNRISDHIAFKEIKSAVPVKSTKKVMLMPGHSPLDWARLTASYVNLSGLPLGAPYLKVPPSLLKKHNGRKGEDAWTVLGNKVYNITPYLPFHPGGEPELLRSAGRDGTRLFNEVHPWVNWEGMLASCFVGIAVEEHEVHAESEINSVD